MLGFAGGSVVKNLPTDAGDTGSIPGSGRCPRGGNGNPRQYSCLGNPMDRGAWRATGHSVAKRWSHVFNESHMGISLFKIEHFFANIYMNMDDILMF